tara:strand:+ start:723 stop:1016 length:294 start_codon:yes stop_codon:yes gene_type:complete
MNKPKLRKTVPGKKKKLRRMQEDLAEKTLLFNKLPDKCLSCDKSFDKNDKQMVMEWTVVVREKQEKVNLWCPECWEKAHELFMDFAKKETENEAQPE